MIRAVIVDDEEHAINILNILLQRIGGVEVVGTASNGFDAIVKLRELRPDVVFLDIEMPGMSGVELAETIGNENLDVQVVFVTAYDRYAISAFEKDAVDYLLKPLEMDRLAKTVQRVKREAAKYAERAGDAAAGAAAIASAAAETAAGAAQPGAAPAPAGITVRLMGDIAVTSGAGERLRWRTSKEKELFAFLALRGRERLHRDVILDALWPDEHYQRAKVYLHTCVSFLRKDLKQLGLVEALIYEGEKYYLRSELLVSDYMQLTGALQETKQLVPERRAEQLERALMLHTGPLFKDEDYPWAEDDIQHLEQTVGELRIELARLYQRSGEYGKMIDAAQKQFAMSPYDEEACRLLMRGYEAAGRRDEVFRVYQQMAARLAELDIEPSEMTQQLFGDIQTSKSKPS